MKKSNMTDIVLHMRKIPALISLIALLMMSIVTTAHADGAAGALTDAMSAASATHIHTDGHNSADDENGVCDCAGCGHQHHSHASLPHVRVALICAAQKQQHVHWNADQPLKRHYPLSKPPRA